MAQRKPDAERSKRRGSESRQRPLLAAFRCTPQELAWLKTLAAVQRKPVSAYLRDSVAAVERIRALHTRSERPVVMTSLCAAHGTRESLLSLRDRAGHDAMRAAAGVCPDCSVTEKYVCTHCRAECPDDDEWPCPTIRALA
jgi:hypothetical protein